MTLTRKVDGETISLFDQGQCVMRMEEHMDNNTIHIKLRGKLVSEAEYDFTDEVQTFILAGKNLVFDLSEVEYLSAAFLHAFLTIQKTLDNKDMEPLLLKGMSSEARKEFDSSGYAQLFEIQDV